MVAAVAGRPPYRGIGPEVPNIGKQVRPGFQCSEPMSKINLRKFYHIPVMPSNRRDWCFSRLFNVANVEVLPMPMLPVPNSPVVLVHWQNSNTQTPKNSNNSTPVCTAHAGNCRPFLRRGRMDGIPYNGMSSMRSPDVCFCIETRSSNDGAYRL